jgi:hypothetical protein
MRPANWSIENLVGEGTDWRQRAVLLRRKILAWAARQLRTHDWLGLLMKLVYWMMKLVALDPFRISSTACRLGFAPFDKGGYGGFAPDLCFKPTATANPPQSPFSKGGGESRQRSNKDREQVVVTR